MLHGFNILIIIQISKGGRFFLCIVLFFLNLTVHFYVLNQSITDFVLLWYMVDISAGTDARCQYIYM